MDYRRCRPGFLQLTAEVIKDERVEAADVQR
jgi:hypothetical protein